MKQFVMFGAVVFGAIGSYLPFLFGDADAMVTWSIVGGLVGGLLGIWLAVKAYNLIG